MIKKYKISDLAKDLNVTSKELIALFDEYTKDHKKASAVLSEEEINIALEIYSQKNEVESFDSYFASSSQKPPEAGVNLPFKKTKDSEKPEKPEKADRQLNSTNSKKDDSKRNSQKARQAKKETSVDGGSNKNKETRKIKNDSKNKETSKIKIDAKIKETRIRNGR